MKNEMRLTGLFVAVVVVYTVVTVALFRPQPAPPPPFTTVEQAREMLHNALKRDPFACGQGLKILDKHPEEVPLRVYYLQSCCAPEPVRDLAGLVAPLCERLNR